MAVIKGSQGVIKAGSDTVAEVRSYSIDHNAEVVEKTSMGDSARSYVSTLTQFTASVEVFYDDTDTAQTALDAGNSVTLEVYPNTTASGSKYYSGTAIVTGITRTGSADGLVEATIALQGSGGLSTLTA